MDSIRGKTVASTINNNMIQGNNKMINNNNNNNMQGSNKVVQNPLPAQRYLQQNFQNRSGVKAQPSVPGKRKGNDSDEEMDDIEFGQPLNGSWQQPKKKKTNGNQRYQNNDGEGDTDESSWSDEELKNPTTVKNNSFTSKINTNKVVQPAVVQKQPAKPRTPVVGGVKTIDMGLDNDFRFQGLNPSALKMIQKEEQKDEEAELAISTLKNIYKLISAKN